MNEKYPYSEFLGVEIISADEYGATGKFKAIGEFTERQEICM